MTTVKSVSVSFLSKEKKEKTQFYVFVSLVDLDSVKATIKRINDDMYVLEHIVFVVRLE